MADLNKDEYGNITFDYDGSQWARIIIAAISRLYVCRWYYMKHYFDKKTSKEVRYVIIGEPLSAEIARNLIQNVLTRIHRQRIVLQAEEKSFKLGAADNIHNRCIELIELAKQGDIYDEEAGTALIVGDFYEKELSKIDDYLNSKLYIKTVKQRSVKINPTEYSNGFSFADSIDLQHKIK